MWPVGSATGADGLRKRPCYAGLVHAAQAAHIPPSRYKITTTPQVKKGDPNP